MPLQTLFGRDRLTFTVTLTVHELRNVPFLSGHYYLKHRLRSRVNSKATTSPRQPLRDHTVTFNWTTLFDVEISKDAHNRLSECPWLLVVKKEASYGSGTERIGTLDLNLSEFAVGKRVVRKMLLQETRTNSTVKISVEMVQKSGPTDFEPPSQSRIPSVDIFYGAINKAAQSWLRPIAASHHSPTSTSTPSPPQRHHNTNGKDAFRTRVGTDSTGSSVNASHYHHYHQQTPRPEGSIGAKRSVLDLRGEAPQVLGAPRSFGSGLGIRGSRSLTNMKQEVRQHEAPTERTVPAVQPPAVSGAAERRLKSPATSAMAGEFVTAPTTMSREAVAATVAESSCQKEYRRSGYGTHSSTTPSTASTSNHSTLSHAPSPDLQRPSSHFSGGSHQISSLHHHHSPVPLPFSHHQTIGLVLPRPPIPYQPGQSEIMAPMEVVEEIFRRRRMPASMAEVPSPPPFPPPGQLAS